LQVSHIAHELHPLSKNAAVSGATAPPTAYKYLRVHASSIPAQIRCNTRGRATWLGSFPRRRMGQRCE